MTHKRGSILFYTLMILLVMSLIFTANEHMYKSSRESFIVISKGLIAQAIAERSLQLEEMVQAEQTSARQKIQAAMQKNEATLKQKEQEQVALNALIKEKETAQVALKQEIDDSQAQMALDREMIDRLITSYNELVDKIPEESTADNEEEIHQLLIAQENLARRIEALNQALDESTEQQNQRLEQRQALLDDLKEAQDKQKRLAEAITQLKETLSKQREQLEQYRPTESQATWKFNLGKGTVTTQKESIRVEVTLTGTNQRYRYDYPRWPEKQKNIAP
ncbi:MAG: hypothetical protein Q4A67_03975 [Aerococcus sp.]|nr:hypothetical protein [Aerococcus sp.]